MSYVIFRWHQLLIVCVVVRRAEDIFQTAPLFLADFISLKVRSLSKILERKNVFRFCLLTKHRKNHVNVKKKTQKNDNLVILKRASFLVRFFGAHRSPNLAIEI